MLEAGEWGRVGGRGQCWDGHGGEQEGGSGGRKSIVQSRIDGQSANKNITVNKPNSLKYKAAATVTALPRQLYLQRDSCSWRVLPRNPISALVLPCS